MSGSRRYAVYYLPEDAALAAFGAAWLGWDAVAGAAVAHPHVAGISEATETPRKYGFHGTLKPPFHLADGASAEALERDVAALAAGLAPVALSGLRLARLGRFLALVPSEESEALGGLAFACVSELDAYRRPASEAELDRRRGGGLRAVQEEMLARWGYPYVGSEFRFHMTLTGRLGAGDLARLEAAARELLPPVPTPFVIGSIALVGSDDYGRFHMIERFALAG